MEQYQKRVIEEQMELSGKITRLEFFVLSEKMDSVQEAEQKRLRQQLNIMKDYRRILNERIEAF